ncbi:MAG: efflux RND transporter permease subunit [Candidatus Ratteibacteria bacterium]|nr:efflux RND transporter permease subunit [Candidatus Ratteibacteria bacterium]
MSLPRFSVRQSLFINLVSVMIIIIGLVVLVGINKEIWPNVAFDVVTVTATYPGAAPLDIEKLISVPIEKELRQVDGIEDIHSSSGTGLSLVYVTIDPDEKNKQKVIRDITSAVDRIRNLPRDVDDPVVMELTARQFPIIEVSLSGKMSEGELRKHADTLEDLLEDVDGVARIKKEGYREREIQILLEPKKLSEYYVSFEEIENALAARNISLPAGKLDTETSEYNIRTTGEFLSAEEIEEVIIRANDSGNWLRIKDVAVVSDTFKDENKINKTMGTRSINLTIVKKESGDALKIVAQVKKKCQAYLKLQGNKLKISYVNDYSFFAKRRLNVLRNNAWVAIILVMSALLIFLHRRVAFITFLGIPVAFFTTFIVMGIMGITINLISMFGLIIVLGMLVDDGIIVAENVYRHMEKGESPRTAAIKGSEEVMGAVVTAVVTTIAAFSPLLFMTGIMGKFIRDLPTVLIVALVASLGEALIILPSHLADFVKIKIDARGNPVELTKGMAWFKKIVSFYTRIIKKAISRKYKVLAGFSGLLLVCVVLSVTVMKFILFPSAGIDFFFARAEAPIGTPLEKTHQLMIPLERVVSKLPAGELDTYVTAVGESAEDRHDPFAGRGSNLGQVTVYLTPEQDRPRSVDEIIAELRTKTKDIEGFTTLRFDKPETGPPVGKAVEIEIRGEDFDTLDQIAKEFMDYLQMIDGASDITWDHKPGQEEIRISVDREKATMAGLTIRKIARTIRAVFKGGIATTIKPIKAEDETDVTVRFSREETGDISVFENILISNRFDTLIPLKKVASIEKVPGTTTIHHLDGKRVVSVSSNVDAAKTTSMKINRLLKNKFRNISDKYLGYSVKYGGEQEETIKSLKSLGKAYFFVFLIVFLMLSSFFRSLIQPFIVMMAIPFGLIGVVLAFLLHGIPLSFMALLGIIGLSGIVVNDSIILVDFINKLRATGMDRGESIIKAGQLRIRPVILTTITTVGGLSTVAYGIGGKDPFLVPMAMALCWGLLFATILTLVIIPCIYSILDDIAIKITKHPSLIRRAKENNNQPE